MGDHSMGCAPLILLSIVLVFAWVASFIVFHVASALIHLLLFVAVILLLIHLLKGRKSA
jgi:Family of unknown function (DUF5670)